MEDVRKQIDEIDNQIVRLLGKRTKLVKKIGRLKKEAELGITDEEREKEVVARLRTLGQDYGLSAEFVERLYGVVFEESRRLQE